MLEPSFLTYEDILFIHHQEIKIAGGEPSMRDREGIKACVDAPKASLDGDYLNDIFGMALRISRPSQPGIHSLTVTSARLWPHV